MPRNGLLFVIGLLATLLVSSAPAAAQQTDESAVRDVVKRLFDGMRTRDTTLMKSVFHAEARMYAHGSDGSIGTIAPAQFVQTIMRAPPGMVLDEVLHDVEVRVDGSLASVWTYYDFFAGERFSHCGYDAFQLLKTGGDWKIVALADSKRTEGCKQKRG